MKRGVNSGFAASARSAARSLRSRPRSVASASSRPRCVSGRARYALSPSRRLAVDQRAAQGARRRVGARDTRATAAVRHEDLIDLGRAAQHALVGTQRRDDQRGRATDPAIRGDRGDSHGPARPGGGATRAARLGLNLDRQPRLDAEECGGCTIENDRFHAEAFERDAAPSIERSIPKAGSGVRVARSRRRCASDGSPTTTVT
jgi:hypothetical protein